MDYEKAFKMLLAANYRGVWITMADGHWWINMDAQQEYGGLHDLLDTEKIHCRSKVYDGPLQAIERVDAAVRACSDGKGLIEYTYTDDWYMGDGKVSDEGITKTA